MSSSSSNNTSAKRSSNKYSNGQSERDGNDDGDDNGEELKEQVELNINNLNNHINNDDIDKVMSSECDGNISSTKISAKEVRRRFSDFGNKSLKDNDLSHIPQISFRSPENIIGWTYARLMYQHFGERFRDRVDNFTG